MKHRYKSEARIGITVVIAENKANKELRDINKEDNRNVTRKQKQEQRSIRDHDSNRRELKTFTPTKHRREVARATAKFVSRSHSVRIGSFQRR